MERRTILVGISPRKKARQELPFPNPKGRWERSASTAIMLSAAVSLGTGLAALVHGTVTYLAWYAVGLAPWLLGCVLALSLRGRPKRDEAVVSAIDRLREQTREGGLGQKPGSGVIGWLTDEGLYTGSARLYRWSSFARMSWRGGRIKASGLRVHQLEFEMAPSDSPLQRLWNRWLLPLCAGLVIAGTGLEAWEAVVGVRRYGLRDDVLTAIAGAVLLLTVLGVVGRLFVGQWWRLGTRGGGILLVDAERFALAEVQAVVPQRLHAPSRDSKRPSAEPEPPAD